MTGSDHCFAANAGTTVTITCDRDIVTARQSGRAFARQLGFSMLETMLVATAISELARNIVLYAQRGQITVERVEQDGRSGVRVVARDDGPGIADVQQVIAGASVIHLGLRGLRRLVDEVEIASILGQGTTVSVTKWLRQA